jgi:hypothetical protein
MHAQVWRVSLSVAGAAGLLVCGGLIGGWLSRPVVLPRVQAVTSQADSSFAVCTVPIDGAVEGFFMLDFETGDLSGGVLNPNTSQFGAAYKHNVLKALGFKPGQVKNPKFLLVAGLADLRRTGNASLAQSVLYVTDSSTGTTVAYGIPWSMQQPQATMALVPLDVARPRGGGAKAK